MLGIMMSQLQKYLVPSHHRLSRTRTPYPGRPVLPDLRVLPACPVLALPQDSGICLSMIMSHHLYQHQAHQADQGSNPTHPDQNHLFTNPVTLNHPALVTNQTTYPVPTNPTQNHLHPVSNLDIPVLVSNPVIPVHQAPLSNPIIRDQFHPVLSLYIHRELILTCSQDIRANLVDQVLSPGTFQTRISNQVFGLRRLLKDQSTDLFRMDQNIYQKNQGICRTVDQGTRGLVDQFIMNRDRPDLLDQL